MSEGWAFLQDWAMFLVIEAAAVSLFFAVYAGVRKRAASATVVFVRVEVFLRPVGAGGGLGGTAVLQQNFFRTATSVERDVQKLGGEVIARPGLGRPLQARLPRRSLPKLAGSPCVERIEPSRAVAFEIGRRR